MTTEELFKKSDEGGLPPTLLLRGNDAYLAREWKSLCAKKGFEIHVIDVKKSGPDARAEEAGQGGSLFGGRTLLWLRLETALSQWKDEAHAIWERMRGRADGEGLVIAVQVPLDKRMKWEALKCQADVSFEALPERRLSWAGRMSRIRDAKLDNARLQFLAQLDEELLALDGYVELWSLGGDAWASRALGWGLAAAGRGGPLLAPGANPAFAWVDAVLSRQMREATLLLRLLLDEGSEPLQLLGLLNKSVRIWAAVEEGVRPASQPPFLIDKMKRLSQAAALRGRGHELLRRCARLDRQLKSSPLNARAALQSLSN